MKNILRTPFEHTLQGLAYWLAYKSETLKCLITEAEVVGEIVNILQGRLPTEYKIVREYPYSNIRTNVFGRQRADLAIINSNGGCECLIEIKLADSTNERYKGDIDKLSNIKKNYPDIDCNVFIIYRKSCSINVPQGLVKNGKAMRKVDGMPNIKVRRVCNAISSKSAKKMKKAIWLEVV